MKNLTHIPVKSAAELREAMKMGLANWRNDVLGKESSSLPPASSFIFTIYVEVFDELG